MHSFYPSPLPSPSPPPNSPHVPSDPFDRIIAATAIVEGIPLLTADKNIRRSRALRTLW